MTDHTTAAQAAMQEGERNAAAHDYFEARRKIDSAEARRIFEAGFDRAYALLSKLRAPVADERAALSQQDILDRFQFLEGLVNGSTYRKIAETAQALYETGAPWANMAQTISDLRAELGYVKQYGSRVLPNMLPPATARDRWMYEQGRLAERAALASAPVAGEAQPVAWANEDVDPISDALKRARLDLYGKNYTRPLVYAAPQASEAQCSCPSGDGSLRHPCAVHPQRSEAVRDAALEEAAQQCEDIYSWREAYAAGILHLNTLSTCASAIRALKSQSAALSAQPGAQKNGGSDA